MSIWNEQRTNERKLCIFSISFWKKDCFCYFVQEKKKIRHTEILLLLTDISVRNCGIWKKNIKTQKPNSGSEKGNLKIEKTKNKYSGNEKCYLDEVLTFVILKENKQTSQILKRSYLFSNTYSDTHSLTLSFKKNNQTRKFWEKSLPSFFLI